MSPRAAARVGTALLAVAMVTVPTWAQSPAELNLFGGEPQKTQGETRNPVVGFLLHVLGDNSGPASAPKPVGLPHTLTFQDGRSLGGELVSLTKDEIIWKRADASEAMHFRRAEVRRIALSEAAPEQFEQEQTPMNAVNAVPGVKDGDAAKPPGPVKPSPATVKLPGGDWLYAEVTSADAEKFVLSLGGDSKFTVPRAAIEWLHFGTAPAPAAHLTAGTMALEGWVRSNSSARSEEKDGWITVKGAEWIGRNVSPPSRFEVAFDLAADDKTATSLWIQPFGPQPNCFGTGTVELDFTPDAINRCIYINNMKHEKSVLPPEVMPDGRARFRVFYDGVDAKLRVFRNGKQVGDWMLREEKDAQQAQRNGWPRAISGICLSRNGGPRLGRLSIQPWDGTLPQAGETARTQDAITVGKEAQKIGRLESIGAKELVFSGEKKPRGAGVFLQLHSDPKPMLGADALLLFGARGELGAAELEIFGGYASFRTSFAEKIEVPVSALNIVAFAPAVVEPAPAGALVFKNGDELPGSLLRAETGAPLQWKTVAGQEITFQPARLAGVRFAPRADAKVAEAAIVELRNGDRLRGEFLALDQKTLQLKHPLLGALGLARERVWALFPNPKTTIFDAANDPGPWVDPAAGAGSGDESGPRQRGVYLDGRFVMRVVTTNNGFNSSESRSSITRDLKGLPDKIELRCEALDVSGNEPNVNFRISSDDPRNGSSSLDLDFNYGSMRLYGWISGTRSRSFWKDVPMRAQNGRYEPTPRIAVRLFVDNKTGTVDVFVNGDHRVKSGQAANERVPGVAGRVSISGYSNTNVPVVVSDIWVGPWSGELPRAGGGATVALSNGDVAEASPKELKAGKLVVDPGSGEMEVPLERVNSIGFGGVPAPVASAGRLRLLGGDAVSVESFKFESGVVTARSAVVGELRVPAEALRELVFDAAPIRFPQSPEPKKKLAVEEPPPPPAPARP